MSINPSNKSSIVDYAMKQHKDLAFGDAVHVPLDDSNRGELKGKSVIVVCPPTRGQLNNDPIALKETLDKTYSQLFGINQQIYENKNNTLVIPCFSIGKGGVDTKMSAEIAISRAKIYVEENLKARVKFVFYSDSLGDQAYNDYKEELMKQGGSDRIVLMKGDIVTEEGDTLAMPIQIKYDVKASGPTTQAILKASQQVLKQTHNSEKVEEHPALDKENEELIKFAKDQNPVENSDENEKDIELKDIKSDKK